MSEARLPVELETIAAEEGHVVESLPEKEPQTPGEWIRKNLFSSVGNGIATVLTAAIVGYLAVRILQWVFGPAEFQVVKSNFRLFMTGRFPLEEVWRVWVSAFLVALLAGLSWGVSGKRIFWSPPKAVLAALLTGAVLLFLNYLLESPRVRLLTLALPAVVLLGSAVGRAGRGVLRRPLFVSWILIFPVVIVILRGFGGVRPALWGGFTLNVLIAVVGIFASFPLGILLALGRRSSLPAVRTVCVGFIELFRGAPLVAWIITGFLLLPLMLPPGIEVTLVMRIMIVFTLFSAAYVAEIVRGGLQGVDRGQYEAARAIGLPARKMMRLVILPQALRNTIPAMISHFISLFKDSSLVAVLATTELLRAANKASGQLTFLAHKKEALLVVALIFWSVAFSMSRWSQRLERRLGVGER